MAKIIVAMAAAAAPAGNVYKSADGMLNYAKIADLQAKINDLLKTTGKKGGDVKVTGQYVTSVKAKPVPYSAASEKKDDLKYHTRRAIKVALRKSVKPESLARVKILLTVVEGADVPAAITKATKLAVAAITQHLKKIEKVKETVTKKRGKLRDASNAVFEKAVDALRDVLEAGGVKDSQIVESTGMMGKTVLVKLGKDLVVSVGKSDITRFNAAVKASKTSESSDDDYPNAADVAKRLQQKTGIQLTSNDYIAWMEGDGDGDIEKFDSAVLKLLRKPTYDKYHSFARLPDKLLFELELGPMNVGGVNVSRNY